MDWVAARHDALVAVLEMLAAEYQLDDENSSALAVTTGETEADAAAAKLAEATDALERDRKPVGWSDPPAVAGNLRIARKRFIKAALRCLSSDYADESAHADAESEYATDLLCITARNLAADVEAHRAAKAETGGRLL